MGNNTKGLLELAHQNFIKHVLLKLGMDPRILCWSLYVSIKTEPCSVCDIMLATLTSHGCESLLITCFKT